MSVGNILLLLLIFCHFHDCMNTLCLNLDILDSSIVQDSKVSLTFTAEVNSTQDQKTRRTVITIYTDTSRELCRFRHDTKGKCEPTTGLYAKRCVCNADNRYTVTEALEGNGWKFMATEYRDPLMICYKAPQMTSFTISAVNATASSILPTLTMDTTGLPSHEDPALPPPAPTAAADSDSAVVVDVNSTVNVSCSWMEGLPPSNTRSISPGLLLRLHQDAYVMPHVQCEDSGPVGCPRSDVIETRTLLVKCLPSGRYDLGEVNFISHPVSVSFTVTAYPVPSQVTFRDLGPSGNASCVRDIDDTLIQLTGRCQSTPGAVHLSTCTVTVTKVSTETAAGFYLVTVTNTQGSGQFRLQVLYTGAKRDSPFYLALAIGSSGALGVVLIVDVIFFIWLWRRQWKLPCADMDNHADSTAQPRTASDDYLTPVFRHVDITDMAIPTSSTAQPETASHDYLEPVSRPVDIAGPYESLQMADVGQSSLYSVISGASYPATTKSTPF